MATDSRTWFYTTPEPRPYYIEERVNHTLWKNRLQTLTMSCTQATVPIKMEGNWQGNLVKFEWQPGKYFTLTTPRDFDISPYFEIVKFNILEDRRFDYRQIRWAD